MKNIILVLSFLCCYTLVSAQIKIGGDTVVQYEYATVTCRIFYQSNTIVYDETGISKSPILILPNKAAFILTYEKQSKNTKFSYVGEVLNYMGSFGWKLINSTTLAYEGDDGNNKSTIINTNEYMQQLIFERPISKE